MITIQTKEWFDKENGNTYFSSEVYLGSDLVLVLPFQYGYNGARQAIENKIAKYFGVSAERWEVRDMLRKNGIELSETKTRALKRELSKESFEDFAPFHKPENHQKYALHRMQNGIPLKHSVMENCFAFAVGKDHVILSDGLGNIDPEHIPFNQFDWF